jgi:hypothetical protein
MVIAAFIRMTSGCLLRAKQESFLFPNIGNDPGK